MLVLVPLSATAEAADTPSVSIRARGNNGSETMKLELNGTVVETWTNVGTSYATYDYDAASATTIDQLRVVFDNNSSTRDLFVDYVEVDGQRFETEASTTLSRGMWNGSCGEGFKQQEKIACNGWAEYQATVGLTIGGDDPTPPPPPPAGDGSSEIVIRARGAAGSERMRLELNGTVLQTWTSVSSSYSTYTHEVTTETTIDALRVVFDNNSSTRDLFVDYVEVDGQRFESEASTVRSRGVWKSGSGCGEGYKSQDKIACNGWFEYETAAGLILAQGDAPVDPPAEPPASPGAAEVSIRARGVSGNERMRLEINGAVVQTWNGILPPFNTYTHTVEDPVTIDRLRVIFDNDATGRDLEIDYLEIGDQRFETESADVRSVGIWTSGTGCSEGYKQSDTINCNGWVEYDATQGITLGAAPSLSVRFEQDGANVAVFVSAGTALVGSITVEVSYDPTVTGVTGCVAEVAVGQCSIAEPGRALFSGLDAAGLSGEIRIGSLTGVSGQANVGLVSANDDIAKDLLGASPVRRLAHRTSKLVSAAVAYQAGPGFQGLVLSASDPTAQRLAGEEGELATSTSRGDATCDGLVDIIDALVITQLAVGNRTDTQSCPLDDKTTEANGAAGDFNQDGIAGPTDSLLIAQCEAGIVNDWCTLPVHTCNGLAATHWGTGTIFGSDEDDVIVSLSPAGSSVLLDGGPGNDVICGGPSDGDIKGGLGDDLIFAMDGNDLIRGGPGNDQLFGGAGNDKFTDGAAGDTIDGGDGFDIATGEPSQTPCVVEVSVSCGTDGTVTDWTLPNPDDERFPEQLFPRATGLNIPQPAPVGECVELLYADIIEAPFADVPRSQTAADDAPLLGWIWVPVGSKVVTTGWVALDNATVGTVAPFIGGGGRLRIFDPKLAADESPQWQDGPPVPGNWAWRPVNVPGVGSYIPYHGDLAMAGTPDDDALLSWHVAFLGYETDGVFSIDPPVAPPCYDFVGDVEDFRLRDPLTHLWHDIGAPALDGCVAAFDEKISNFTGTLSSIAEFALDPIETTREISAEVVKIYNRLKEAEAEGRLMEALAVMAGDALVQELKINLLQGPDGEFEITPQRVSKFAGYWACRVAIEYQLRKVRNELSNMAGRLLSWRLGTRNDDPGVRTDPDRQSELLANLDCVRQALGPNSFPAGTPVLLADGSQRPIEEIEIGNEVLSFDFGRGSWEPQVVTDHWSHPDDGHSVTLTLTGGAEVTSTDDHPYFRPDIARWTEAADLVSGDQLLTPEGPVAVIRVEQSAAREWVVWDLSVAENANFAVLAGDNAVLVHNFVRTPCDEMKEDMARGPYGGVASASDLEDLHIRWVQPKPGELVFGKTYEELFDLGYRLNISNPDRVVWEIPNSPLANMSRGRATAFRQLAQDGSPRISVERWPIPPGIDNPDLPTGTRGETLTRGGLPSGRTAEQVRIRVTAIVDGETVTFETLPDFVVLDADPNLGAVLTLVESKATLVGQPPGMTPGQTVLTDGIVRGPGGGVTISSVEIVNPRNDFLDAYNAASNEPFDGSISPDQLVGVQVFEWLLSP